jgi:D-inositol-3-phosphate glycosyltransferase
MIKTVLKPTIMKRRIAFITEYAPYLKGSRPVGDWDESTDLSGITNHLCANGWKVDVFTFGAHVGDVIVTKCGADLQLIEIQAGSRVHSAALTRLNDERLCLSVQSFIVDNNLSYQLIHANLFKSGAIAVALKKRLRIPIVVSLSQLCNLTGIAEGCTDLSSCSGKKTAQILKKADAVIVNNADTKTMLTQDYKPGVQKTFIVPGGFNPNALPPLSKIPARRRLNLAVDGKILLYVGDLSQDHGCETIIKSMALLDMPGQKLRLVMLHDSISSPLFNSAKLLHVADSLGLKEQVIFIDAPKTADLNVYCSAADLFLAPTLSVKSGDLALKCMAFGTPVMELGSGHVKASMVDGRTGFLMCPIMSEVLADRITLLLTNERLLHQMGRDAVAHVYSSFTWEKIAAQMLPLYNYVLSASRKKNLVAVPIRKKIKKGVATRNVFSNNTRQVELDN